MGHHGRRVAKALNLKGDLAKQAQSLIEKLYAAFVAKDGFQNSAMLLSADEARLARALVIFEPRSKWTRANFSRGDEA